MLLRIVAKRDRDGDVYYFAERRRYFLGLIPYWSYVSNTMSFRGPEFSAEIARNLLRKVPEPHYLKI